MRARWRLGYRHTPPLSQQGGDTPLLRPMIQAPCPRGLLSAPRHISIPRWVSAPSTPPCPHAVPGDAWPACGFQAVTSVSCLRRSVQASRPVKCRTSEMLFPGPLQKAWTHTALPLTSMCFRLSRSPSAKRVTTSLWSSSSCRTSWQYWASSA